MSDIPTDEQIMAASPQELDVMAAVMMGWQRFDTRPSHWCRTCAITNLLTGETTQPSGGPWWLPPGVDVNATDGGCELPHPSTDIAAAMRLVEETDHPALIGYKWDAGYSELEPQFCTIALPYSKQVTACAATVALAITRAAVLAWAAQERAK